MSALDTVVRTVPRALVYQLLSELGCARDDVKAVHIDYHGITVEMWARNEWGARYMTGGETAQHTICIPIESAAPLRD